jgi:transcriptional regulator with XRE-family HTH domain
MRFGDTIAHNRKQLGLTQKHLAEVVRKQDGEPITPQYLNDIEHNRRTPSSPEIVEQLARALKLQPEILYFKAGALPADLTSRNAISEDQIVAAFQAFREKLESKSS